MRLAVAGAAGAVGSATAYSCVLRGDVEELILLDRRAGPLAAHVLDLEQLRAGVRPFSVRAGDWSDAAGSDVLVISASAPHRDGAPRADYLHENVAIIDAIADALLAAAPALPGTIVVASNPVDVLVTRLRARLGCARSRVLGFAFNDSTRLRFATGQALGVEPSRVTAWSLGEHGPHAVPLLDRVTVDGSPVVLDRRQRASVRSYLDGWYGRWQATSPGRTSAWMSGAGLADLVRALRTGATPYPASVVLDGEYGIDGLALVVPLALSPFEVLDWDLSPADRTALSAAAAAVAADLARL